MVAQIDGDYLKAGTRRTLRRLSSYAFFEGRPHTTRGQWFNPVVFAWLRLIAAVPGNARLDRPIFITGLGRSGTTLLGVLLSLHRDVGFLNEPKAIWTLIDPRHDVCADYSKTNGRFHLSAATATVEKAQLAQRVFARYLTLTGGQRLVDKYPEMIFRIDYLLSLFPDAKVLFITRNGPDACSSISQWSVNHGRNAQASHEDWWGRNDAKWRYFSEQILLQDSYFRDCLSILPSATPVDRAALEWIATMREGKTQCERHPKSLMRVTYEELTRAPRSAIERILNFCELPADDAVTGYADERVRPNSPKRWPTLAPAIEARFIETMNAIGYPSNREEEPSSAGR